MFPADNQSFESFCTWQGFHPHKEASSSYNPVIILFFPYYRILWCNGGL